MHLPRPDPSSLADTPYPSFNSASLTLPPFPLPPFQSLPVLPTLLPQLQRLASRNPPPSHSFLLARATTLSFSLLPSGEPDKDVLPTMLIYGPGGELLENWVRVDLMLQGQIGLEGLLVR